MPQESRVVDTLLDVNDHDLGCPEESLEHMLWKEPLNNNNYEEQAEQINTVA